MLQVTSKDVTPKAGKRANPNKINLFVDLAIALAFAVEMEVHFTGLPIHELLGLAFLLAIVVHLILHWQWIVNITKTFFAKLLHDSRLNYVLNVALFIDLLVIMVTGVLISRTLGFRLASEDLTGSLLQPLHLFSSHLILILTGVHIGLHWKWIVTNGGKYLLRLPSIGRKPAQTSVNTQHVMSL
ncbi:MAG: DUF4405 domain-containing protein [Anaerolineae bacterium]